MDFSPYDPDSAEEKQKQAARERLARERRRRAHISMFSLPPFETPKYDELRKLYRVYRHDPDVRRLVLEIQCGRYAFSELAALAAECLWDLDKERANLDDARKTFARLRHRLRKELERIGQIHALPK